jgi:hypothetical protein
MRHCDTQLSAFGTRLIRVDAMCCAAILAIIGVSAIVWSFDRDSSDFVQYYMGGHNLIHTGNPYTLDAEAAGLSDDWRFCYPPLLAIFMTPLSRLSLTTASEVWLWLNIGLTVVLAGMLRTLCGWSWRAIVPLSAILFIFPAHHVGLKIGQLHVVVAVLLAGMMIALDRDREWLAAVLLAVAALIKVFPGFLIPALFVAGYRRAAIAALCLGVAAFCCLWNDHLQYLQDYVLASYYPIAAQCFVSVPALAARLFSSHEYGAAIADLPELKSIAIAGTILTTTLAGTWMWCRGARRDELIAAMFVAVLLITPPAGMYHLNICLIGVALLCRSGRLRSGWTLLSLGLISIPVEYGISAATAPAFYELIHSGWGLLLLVPQLYGLLLLAAMIVRGASPFDLGSIIRSDMAPAALSVRSD